MKITLTGLSLVLANFATLVYYDPKFLTEKEGADGPPNWIYFTCVYPLPDWDRACWSDGRYRWAIGLFLYQSLDAIDGYVHTFSAKRQAHELVVECRKQARRTGMAGPLGEMFDHGCDALNTTVRHTGCFWETVFSSFCLPSSSKSSYVRARSILVGHLGRSRLKSRR